MILNWQELNRIRQESGVTPKVSHSVRRINK